MARKPTAEATVSRGGLAPRAFRPALAAQLTGLNRAIPAIQPGTTLSDRNAPDRKVSGSTSVVDAAIRISRLGDNSASPFERPAMASAISTETTRRAAMPAAPPGKAAPIPHPIKMMMADCTMVVTAWYASDAVISAPRETGAVRNLSMTPVSMSSMYDMPVQLDENSAVMITTPGVR